MKTLMALGVLGSCILTGCANKPPSLPQTCFGAAQVASWYPIDRNVLRVNAKNGFFEVRVHGACPDLESKPSIGFWSHNGKICGSPWDELRFGPETFTREFSKNRSRCALESVERISRDVFFAGTREQFPRR